MRILAKEPQNYEEMVEMLDALNVLAVGAAKFAIDNKQAVLEQAFNQECNNMGSLYRLINALYEQRPA